MESGDVKVLRCGEDAAEKGAGVLEARRSGRASAVRDNIERVLVHPAVDVREGAGMDVRQDEFFGAGFGLVDGEELSSGVGMVD